MGELSTAMAAELASESPQLNILCEIGLPTGDEQWALYPAGVSTTGYGYYAGLVQSWGHFLCSAEATEGGLETQDKTIILVDVDGKFSDLDAAGYRLMGSAVTFYLGSPNVPNKADWFTLYSGYLRSVALNGDGTATATFRPGIDVLSTLIPRERLLRSDFPLIDPAAEGGIAPRIWGTWSALAGEAKGAISCAKVDTSATSKHVVAIGHMLSVPRVYQAGTLKTSGADYSIGYPIINGREWTRIDFTGDTGTDEVKADVEGYDSNGDGTGTLIDDPVDLLESLCSTIWQGTPPLDATSLADTKTWLTSSAQGAPIKAALLLDQQRSGWDILSDWAQSFGARIYLKFNGEVAISHEDTFATGYVSGSERFRQPEDFIGNPTWQRRETNLVRSVRVAYGSDQTASTGTILVLDPLSGAQTDGDLTLAVGPASAA
jgi:hypothetical protein